MFGFWGDSRLNFLADYLDEQEWIMLTIKTEAVTTVHRIMEMGNDPVRLFHTEAEGMLQITLLEASQADGNE